MKTNTNTNKNLLKLKKLDAFLKKNDMHLFGEDVGITFYTKDLKNYKYNKLNLSIGKRRVADKNVESYISEYSNELKNIYHITDNKLEHKYKAVKQ